MYYLCTSVYGLSIDLAPRDQGSPVPFCLPRLFWLFSRSGVVPMLALIFL